MSNPEIPQVTTLDEYQKAASATAMYADKVYPFLGLCGESGEVAELAKKCMRDDRGLWSVERREKLKLELGDVAWYLAAIARDHGFTLSEICQANIEKLYSRKARNVITGSGDHR